MLREQVLVHAPFIPHSQPLPSQQDMKFSASSLAPLQILKLFIFERRILVGFTLSLLVGAPGAAYLSAIGIYARSTRPTSIQRALYKLQIERRDDAAMATIKPIEGRTVCSS